MSDDYDFEPRKAPSLFLKLAEKGDKVTIRIASKPYREPKIWKTEGKAPPMATEEMLKLTRDDWVGILREPEYTVSEVFHWKVVDRGSGAAKIFSGTAGIYKNIKKYAQNDKWGDVTMYDLEIERTETPGNNYYSVTALPDKSIITEKEQDMVDEIDMHAKVPAARKLSESQVDEIDEGDADPRRTLSNEIPDEIADDDGGPIQIPPDFLKEDDDVKDRPKDK